MPAKDWTKIQKKYKGRWVAFAKDEETVLGSGKTAQGALKDARKHTDETPYLAHMPEKIVTYVGGFVRIPESW